MAQAVPQSFRMPPLESLPNDQVTLAEVVRFIGTFELALIRHFQAQWGDEYRSRVQTLWKTCITTFQDGLPAAGRPDDLLMCLVYDCVVGPYLGGPGPQTLKFWLWLIEGVRRQLAGCDDPAESGKPATPADRLRD
jgi:hypothetical protein